MTNPIRKELSIGNVQYQGQKYEAIVVYQGEKGGLPAAWAKNVGQVKAIYRTAIETMIKNSARQPSMLEGVAVIKDQKIYIDQSVIARHMTKPWAKFVDFLNKPETVAQMVPVILSEDEYSILRGLFNSLEKPPKSYTKEQQAVLEKLNIPIKPEDEEFHFSIAARYLEFTLNASA